MSITRRKALLAATVVATSVALTACSGPSTASPGDSSASPSASSGIDFTGVKPAKSITFWSADPGGSKDVIDEVIKGFTAKTGIAVQHVSTSSYEDTAQKFQAAQAAGGKDLPDVATLSDVWWFRFKMNDQIIPLDSVMDAAGIDPATYNPVFFGDYQYDGSQWGIPLARSTPMFYYNKADWAAAGLPDRAPATWQEFAQWAPKLQAVNGGAPAYEWPDIAGYAGWIGQDLLWGWGGGWSKKDSFDITADQDANVTALKFMQDSIFKDKWAAQAAKDATADLVAKGTSSTIASAGSFIGIAKALDTAGKPFELGSGPLPGGPEATTNVAPTGGTGVSIVAGKSKENQLAAAEFIAYLTNPENAVKFSEATGYIPVRTDADTTDLFAKYPTIGQAFEQAKVSRSQDFARVYLPGGDQEMNKAIQSITTSADTDPKKALGDLQTSLQKIYDDSVKPNL